MLLAVGASLLPVAAAPTLSWNVVKTHPHDSTAFTQGLVIEQGRLIEGTGLYGQSRLTISDLTSGVPIAAMSLAGGEFGEGVAVVGDKIIQLTWMNHVAHVYDDKLRMVGSFPLKGEGWGLAFTGRELALSDGSSSIQFLDPQTYVETRRIEVIDDGLAITRLNELEWVDGRLYANVWQTDRIAVIDQNSGKVLAWLDLTGLSDQFAKPPNWDSRDFVLNGIAYDPKTRHFHVTGKFWPLRFELAVDFSALKKRQR